MALLALALLEERGDRVAAVQLTSASGERGVVCEQVQPLGRAALVNRGEEVDEHRPACGHVIAAILPVEPHRRHRRAAGCPRTQEPWQGIEVDEFGARADAREPVVGERASVLGGIEVQGGTRSARRRLSASMSADQKPRWSKCEPPRASHGLPGGPSTS